MNTARLVKEKLLAANWTITFMESCTSGLLASLLTDNEGASAVFRGSIVTYSNEAKVACGVPAAVIAEHGVYSQETARAMASACRAPYGAAVGIGVTGSFGNADPANADSEPGVAYYALDLEGSVFSERVELGPYEHRIEFKLELAGIIARRLLQLLG